MSETMTEETSNPTDGPDAGTEARERYHHGDLANALLAAAEALIAESGPEAVSFRAVARRVGVTGPAAYRHYTDKYDLYSHLAARGFDALTVAMRDAISRHPKGSVEALIAAGQAYVAFVTARPALFELMWGSIRERYAQSPAESAAQSCYGVFRETLGGVMAARGIGGLDP